MKMICQDEENKEKERLKGEKLIKERKDLLNCEQNQEIKNENKKYEYPKNKEISKQYENIKDTKGNKTKCINTNKIFKKRYRRYLIRSIKIISFTITIKFLIINFLLQYKIIFEI